jgi:hypothetical protein
MSAADRYGSTPTPRPVSSLTRPELAARIAVLRSALEMLWQVTELTGGTPFDSIGRCRRELIELEVKLRFYDQLAGHQLPQPAALAAVGQGLKLGTCEVCRRLMELYQGVCAGCGSDLAEPAAAERGGGAGVQRAG